MLLFFIFHSINPTQDPIVVVAGQRRTAVLDRFIYLFSGKCVARHFWQRSIPNFTQTFNTSHINDWWPNAHNKCSDTCTECLRLTCQNSHSHHSSVMDHFSAMIWASALLLLLFFFTPNYKVILMWAWHKPEVFLFFKLNTNSTTNPSKRPQMDIMNFLWPQILTTTTCIFFSRFVIEELL